MGLKTNPDEKDAYALIIGISTYKDTKIPKLNYTTHDAQAIFDLLVNPDMAGFKKENVKFFLDDEATLFNIKDAISNWLFKNAKEDSMVFIFFAGHGGVEEDRFGIEKDNLAKYLLPYDADFDNFFASALSNSDFNRLLLSIKSKRLVVFMDSCYSGGVTEKKARDVKIVEDLYEKMAEGEGRLVIAASQPDQRSFEDENLGHGIFTHHLIEALSGAADFDINGYVTAMEVYKYLSETVPKTARRLAGGVQEPILRGDLKTDFVLTVSRKRLEEIKHADIKKRNLKRLSDWYHDEKLGAAQYELACRLIESSFEDLRGDDKKVLKSLNDLLSEKISISTFRHDVESITGLEELPIVISKLEKRKREEQEAKQEEERLRKEKEEQERLRRREEEEKKALEEAEKRKREEQKPTFTNSIGMEFVYIPAGEFEMGSPLDEEGRDSDEGPVRHVTIEKAFYMGKYEVTQKQWREIMGGNPSSFEGDDLPVEMVSWNDVQKFIKKLNKKEGTDKYRLPSEAEWEYACRADTITRYSFGDDESKLGDYAWYHDNSHYNTHPIGQKKPNSWGLYDMHGNVWEWVQDKWHDCSDGAPTDGSAWESGFLASRVFRGGSWIGSARECRSARRSCNVPRSRGTDLGFRLLREQ